MHRHQVIVLASVSLLLVAGCGGGDAEATTSPFEELFGGVESPAESRRKQLQQEEIVAQCMRDLGWEYTPVDWAAQFPDQPEEELYGQEYSEKYGYGVARSYELYELPYLDENGEYTDEGPVGGGFEDPNMEYVNSLSPSENQQYYEDLYGGGVAVATVPAGDGEFEEVPATEVPALEDMGCSGKAQQEVWGDQPWNDPDFSERFGELSQDIENDPRLEDAEIAWSDCMYEISEDYDFYGPEDMYQYVTDLFAEKKGQERVEVDPDTGEIIGRPGEYPEGGWSQDEGDDVGYGYTGQARRLTEEEIRAFQELELDIWHDDQSCLEDSGYTDLRRQLEQDIVDTLRDEFPDIVRGADDGDGGDE